MEGMVLRKLKKVIFEFETSSGETLLRTLRGQDAENWNNDLNYTCTIADKLGLGLDWVKYESAWHDEVLNPFDLNPEDMVH